MTQGDPIFIVGAPRSGTTLLRAMLNRHPRIGLSDETYFFYYVYLRRRAFGDLSDPDNRKRLIACYAATQRWQRLKLDSAALADRLMAEGTSYPAFFESLLRFYAESFGKVRYGEKTPHHAWYVDELLGWYPESRVIHLVRDPRDVCASLYNVPWGRKTAVANARLWVSLTAAAERGQGNPRFLRVRYEDLVREPEPVLRGLCEFLGEPFDAAMLGSAPVSTADRPWFERAQGRLSTSRLGTWRDQLTGPDVRLLETVAGEWMDRMGYERSARPAGAALRLKGRARAMLEELTDRVKRAPRLWYFWVQPRNLAAEEAWVDR